MVDDIGTRATASDDDGTTTQECGIYTPDRYISVTRRGRWW